MKQPWLIAASINSAGSFSISEGSDAMSATCSKSSRDKFKMSATKACFSARACLIASSLRLKCSVAEIIKECVKFVLA